MVNAQQRLLNDLSQLKKHPLPGINAAPLDEKNLLVWKAVISGPPQSPYENGTFTLNLTFTLKYPFEAPTVRFLEEMYHPNVYQDGLICMDILQNKWSPTYDVSKILLCVQILLDQPNPQSPANHLAANMFVNEPSEFNKYVRQMVDKKVEKFTAQQMMKVQNNTKAKDSENKSEQVQPAKNTSNSG